MEQQGTVAPPINKAAKYVRGRFVVTAEERDTLVRHARSVIYESGDEMTGGGEEEVRRASQHVAVMVRLLDQLGWSERERPHHGDNYLLLEEVLPIEQIRVWVGSRFRVTEEEAVDESVRGGLCEDLEIALRQLAETLRLLHRMNARANYLSGERALLGGLVAPSADEAATAARREG